MPSPDGSPSPPAARTGATPAFAGAVLAFLAVLSAARAGGIPLFLAVNRFHAAWLDPAMLAVTELGNAAFTVLLLALLVPFRRRPALGAVVAVILAGIACEMLKGAFGAPRPPALLGGEVHVLGPVLRGGSFPSGHTATAFAAVFALRGAFPGFTGGRAWWALAAVAGLVGWSRVYIGVHFPSDVAAGALVGFLAGEAARGPLAPVSAWAARGGAVSDRVLLVLGALCALYLGWFERLLAWQFTFLRSVGIIGTASCLALLARTFVPREGEAGDIPR
jgi:membrane-associated phospholipid phosphatase